MAQLNLVVVLSAYLIGSIPFAHIITQWRTGLRLRDVGEGNVGSRNAWHVAGPQWGSVVAILDGLKGYVVCLVASAIVPTVVVLLAGVAVVLGHQFPIFLRGRGGKGLITALGVLFALSPLSSLVGLAVLGLAYLFLRDFNPSVTIAIVAIILLPLLFHQPLWVSGYTLGLALLAALKKRLDYSHETAVWASRPWQGAGVPGWQRRASPASDEASPPDVRPH